MASDKDVTIQNHMGNKKLKHDSSSSSSSSSSTSKPARIRTVLNEKQLHTLRACYLANSRPDSIMKEQLVEMTGLSPRVIRVWFQNKRCKDKKKTLVVRNDSHSHHHHHQQQSAMYEHCFWWIQAKKKGKFEFRMHGMKSMAICGLLFDLNLDLLFLQPWNDRHCDCVVHV